MKKLLLGLAVLVALIVIAIIAVPFLVPVERLKAEVVARVKEATGRELRIEGPVKLSLVPRLELELAQVAFANAPGASSKDMARLARLQLALEAWPLLSGEVVIDRLVLDGPVIQLEVDKQGRPNWVFAEKPAPAKPGTTAEAGQGGNPLAMLNQLRLDDIRLVNGKVVYADQRTGSRTELDNINVKLALPSLDEPFTAQGDVTWRGEKLTLDLAAAKPRNLIEAQGSPVTMRVAAKPLTFDFKGDLANASPARIVGDIDLKVPSVRQLAAWTGNPVELAGSGLGPLAIAGRVDVAGPKVAFNKARLSLDAIKGTGEIAVDAGGAKPVLRGKLDLETLDLNPYLPPETQPAAPGAAPAGGAGAPATQAGWSDAPIDASPLKAADADFALSVGGIRYRKITIGKSALAVLLKNGRLTADLKELELYKGNGRAQLVVDGASGAPAIETNLSLSKIDAETLLRDAAGVDRLAGSGSFELAAKGRGKSQREIVGSLDGKGGLNFTNGAIKGINLAAMVRNVASAFTAPPGTEKTDFSELAGTFTIAKGIVTNRDLAMKSPLLRIEGAGTIDLPHRTINYRVTPQAVATLEGQGGRSDITGVMVPVVIEGPWEKPSYRPDVGAIIQQQLGDPSQLLKNLPGVKPPAGQPPGGQAPPSGQAPKPSDVLKGILGR